MALLTLSAITLADTLRPFFWGRDDVGGDTIAAALHGVNWWFISGSRGYIGPAAVPSPVQHFWSLSVEEQFYLALPLLLAGSMWLACRRSWDRVTTVISVAGVAAVTSVVVGLLTGGERAYFGTDTRAVELLVGVIAGALAHRGALDAPGVQRLLELAWPPLLAALVVVWVTAPASTGWMFTGAIAVLGAGAAVVVAGVDRLPGSAGPLRHPVVVALGRRSYSLYLVHWPAILATSPRAMDASAPVRWIVRIAVIAVLTEAGFRLVESPIRGRRSFSGVRLGTSYLGAVAVVIIVTLPTVPMAFDAPQRVEAVAPPELPHEVARRFDREGELARLGRRPEMLPDPDPALPVIVLRGDSTARYLGGPLSYDVSAFGYRLVNLGAPGCVLGGNPRAGAEQAGGCPALDDERVVAKTLRPAAVVFTFGVADVALLASTDPDRFAQRLKGAVDAYVTAGASVVLVRPWPQPRWQQVTDPADVALVSDQLEALADATDGVTFSDGGGLFDGPRRDDRALRPDGVHVYDQALGRRVVRTTLGPALDTALQAAAAER
jgi:peptidoglycan/LPS O-acetylase OafA/YrhL